VAKRKRSRLKTDWSLTYSTKSPDLAARRLLVCAYLYYVLDASPLMSDYDYDALSQYVANHWSELDPLRQWQLGDPESTRASGAHFLFTAYSIHSARRAYLEHFNRYAPGEPPEEWLERSGRAALRDGGSLGTKLLTTNSNRD
jgi:hypothetical protein